MKHKPLSLDSHHRGFALIVTLSLMILLTVIAVGLLTLSAISLKSASLDSAQAVARSNARMALMIAIGELQKGMGPDQRISASASSVNPSSPQPNMVGVWESFGWQGPDGGAPSPSEKPAKFREWLVSSKSITAVSGFSFADQSATADSIWLCNPTTTGTIAPNNTALRAERVPVTTGRIKGGMAWAVSDNSSKASINIPRDNSVEIARNLANRTAAASPRPGVLSNAFDNLGNVGALISMKTAVIPMGTAKAQELTARSQALTTSSLGLLANPVKGGLKTDLTPLLEGSSDLDSALGASSPYFPSVGSQPGDGAPTWAYLRNHYQLYKRVTSVSAGTPLAKLADADIQPVPRGELGLKIKPDTERLLPVIAKLQIVFSLVSHYAHVTDRVQANNNFADPKGNTNHAVPHLAYDPVITLYNPYDVALELSQLRIRVSDPPVGFQFQKHDMTAGTHSWFRQEYAKGEFQGLARFQIDRERDVNARKTFTLFLRYKSASKRPGIPITLLPGEVKVFSPWVEPNWTWGLETSGGDYTPRSFFDWNVNNNMGNEDRRTNNKKGVETLTGLDFRAGLQTDHLSYGSNRPADTLYPWEIAKGYPFGVGFVSLKLTDEVTVNCRPQRCVNDEALPDFRVDIMAGNNADADSDILRTFDFRLGNPAVEMATASNSTGTIRRRFRNSDILQIPGDRTPGGKSPFAIFTMSAKTTKDSHDDSKAWTSNNMVVEGAQHDSRKIGNAAQSYDLRLEEIQDFTTFPGVEFDAANERGYFGAIANASRGVSIVPMYRVPLTPAASLGDWISSNLIASSQFPRVNASLGGSFANSLIPSGSIQGSSPMGGGSRVLDHTYLMNAALWDSYYLSSATAYSSDAFTNKKTRADVLEGFFGSQTPMLNSCLVPYLTGTSDPKTFASKLDSKTDEIFAKEFAKNAMIRGAFNINSDSADAWRAVLSSLRETAVKGYANQTYQTTSKTAFVRNGLPVASSSDDANPGSSVNALGQIRWAGFRSLTDDQIKNLASLIVEEIRARGVKDKAPSLCLGDFVNRRPGSPSDLHALKGILQTAIDRSDINTKFHALDSNIIDSANLAPDRTTGLATPKALDGNTADGAAPMLTQGDLLTGLAPIITARGDTFTIRTYGEARKANGTDVEARAWCEATVQRIPEYVDPTDDPAALPSKLTVSNQAFGRRFVVTSFRWLNPSEI